MRLDLFCELPAVHPWHDDIGQQQVYARVTLAMAPCIRNLVPEDTEGVFQYYEALAGMSGMALMPYNTQGWSAEFFCRLAQIDNIIGVKDPCQHPHHLFRAI